MIKNLTEYQGHSWIKLNKDSASYVLRASGNILLDEPKLYKFLRVGDSIFKPRTSDSLYIFRKDFEYLFILGNHLFKKAPISINGSNLSTKNELKQAYDL